MPCTQIPALPSGSTILTGSEVFPGADGSGITRKYGPGAVANYGKDYESTIPYPEGAVVHAADDNLYYALQGVPAGNFPELSPTYWKLLVVSNSVTLNVPADYATIIVALEALSDAILSDTVTIQVADGAYNYTTTQLNLSHPYGRFIRVLGNTGTPASCSLSFSGLPNPPSSPYLNADSGSIYASGESGIFIDGFSILKSGGAPAFGHCGILASNGAVLNVGASMIVSGFYANIASLNGGLTVSDIGLALTTVAGAYGLLADNGTIQAPDVAIGGPGDAVLVQRGGYLRINGATIDAAIRIFATMAEGTLEATSATIGNIDTFYDVDGSGNIVSDAGATFGTASVADISLGGSLNYNGALVVADAQDLSLAQIVNNALQTIVGPNQTVFMDDALPGINTIGTDLNLSADGNRGITVAAATGAVDIPISLTVGATATNTGYQGGTGALDGSGVLTVVASWVTANTIIVPAFISGTPTGTRLAPVITPGVNFTLTSDGGAADSGVNVNWIAIVYP